LRANWLNTRRLPNVLAVAGKWHPQMMRRALSDISGKEFLMKWSEEEISYARRRYFDDGATYREIGEESGRTESSVRNMMNRRFPLRLGERRANQQADRNTRNELIRRDVADGMDVEAGALKYGVSKSTIDAVAPARDFRRIGTQDRMGIGGNCSGATASTAVPPWRRQ
jgi:hypothetical protein